MSGRPDFCVEIKCLRLRSLEPIDKMRVGVRVEMVPHGSRRQGCREMEVGANFGMMIVIVRAGVRVGEGSL